MPRDHFTYGTSLEGMLTGQGFIRHHADRIEIAPNIGRRALPDFRSRVTGRSGESNRGSTTPSHSDVGDLHDPTSTQQYVSGLQVSVDLAVAVKVSEPPQEACQNASNLVRGLRLAHLPHPIGPLDQFHRVVGLAGGQRTPVEDLDQILVADLAEGVEFASKKRRFGGCDQLQRELAIADRVIDSIHAA